MRIRIRLRLELVDVVALGVLVASVLAVVVLLRHL